ncbi:MAG: hypothetical protein ABIJ08_04050 [Nanoarchaeota archaeon]
MKKTTQERIADLESRMMVDARNDIEREVMRIVIGTVYDAHERIASALQDIETIMNLPSDYQDRMIAYHHEEKTNESITISKIHAKQDGILLIDKADIELDYKKTDKKSKLIGKYSMNYDINKRYDQVDKGLLELLSDLKKGKPDNVNINVGYVLRVAELLEDTRDRLKKEQDNVYDNVVDFLDEKRREDIRDCSLPQETGVSEYSLDNQPRIKERSPDDVMGYIRKIDPEIAKDFTETQKKLREIEKRALKKYQK